MIDLYATRTEAEETLRPVLEDEPGWVGMLEVVEVELGVGRSLWYGNRVA